MMKKSVLSIAILLIAILVHAQDDEKPKPKYSIKMYNLLLQDKENLASTTRTIQGYPYILTRTQRVNFFHPTIAIQWKRKNIQEIELSFLDISKERTTTIVIYDSTQKMYTTAIEKAITTNIMLRYEYIFSFLKNKKAKLQPMLGIGVSPYYERIRMRHNSSSMFNETRTETGMLYFVIPRLQWSINSRFFADLNIPFPVTNMKFKIQRIDDPSLPISMQRYSIMEFNAFPNYYSVRVGAGIRL